MIRVIRMKDKDIITRIKKAYEVKAPDILDKLSFTEDAVIFASPKKNFMPIRKVVACCASLVLVIGVGVISIMHFNIGNNNKVPPNINVLEHPVASGSADDETNVAPNTDVSIVEDQKVSYEISYSCDYIWTSVEDLYENADLVIIGTYKETKNTYYAKDYGRLISTGVVEAETVVKGNLIDMNFEIEYYGGIMSVSDFINQNGKEVTKQFVSDNLEEQEVKERYIGEKSGTSVNAREGHKYLMFLNYDKDTDHYFVGSDGYGMREVNNEGKVWNIDSSKYEQINFENIENIIYARNNNTEQVLDVFPGKLTISDSLAYYLDNPDYSEAQTYAVTIEFFSKDFEAFITNKYQEIEEKWAAQYDKLNKEWDQLYDKLNKELDQIKSSEIKESYEAKKKSIDDEFNRISQILREDSTKLYLSAYEIYFKPIMPSLKEFGIDVFEKKINFIQDGEVWTSKMYCIAYVDQHLIKQLENLVIDKDFGLGLDIAPEFVNRDSSDVDLREPYFESVPNIV